MKYAFLQSMSSDQYTKSLKRSDQGNMDKSKMAAKMATEIIDGHNFCFRADNISMNLFNQLLVFCSKVYIMIALRNEWCPLKIEFGKKCTMRVYMCIYLTSISTSHFQDKEYLEEQNFFLQAIKHAPYHMPAEQDKWYTLRRDQILYIIDCIWRDTAYLTQVLARVSTDFEAFILSTLSI